MKRVLAIAFLLIILFGAWWLFFKTDKVTSETSSDTSNAIKEKKHSSVFNTNIENTINSYLVMKDAFVNGDTGSIKSASFAFISRLDSLNLSDLQNEDAKVLPAATQYVSEMKTNTTPILQESDLTKMRRDFQNVSENLYPFLRTIGYEGEKLYWQNCPMAFGDDGANWISNTSEIVNPYLGKNHPEFKSAMLNCGENMDSIYVR